jgi:AcrR family transcriptional regulator
MTRSTAATRAKAGRAAPARKAAKPGAPAKAGAKPAAKPSARARASGGRTKRTTYHHGDLRRALVDAAVAIIGTAGAQGFTLRETARRVGVNHRAAYRHFADKTALLAAVAEQGYRELVATAQRELDRHVGPRAAGAEARLLAVGRAYVAFALERPAYFGVMFGPRLNEEGRFPSLESPIEEAYRLLVAEIQRGVDDGSFRRCNERDTANALWAAMHGLASLVLTRRVRVKPELLGAYCDRIFGVTVAGLRA